MRNSARLIKEAHPEIEKPRIAFSTTNYHVLRSGLIATSQGIAAEGIGSLTRTYFWINAFIREFIANLVAEKKRSIWKPSAFWRRYCRCWRPRSISPTITDRHISLFSILEEPNMTINKTQNGSTLTLSLEGRLDTVTSPELEKVISYSIEGVKELIIDLEKLDYISSAGLRVLLSAQKKMNVQGTMKVVHVNEVVSEVFDITGFCDILTIE